MSYGPPPGAPYQQGYSPYPPQQGGYGPPQGPPPGQYQQYPPQQGNYGGHPPAHQGGWGGPPPPQQGYNQGPPMGQQQPPYGQQQFGGGPPPHGPPQGAPAGPSLGYTYPPQMPPMDMSRAADDCRRAMKGFGTDEALLITTLARLDPIQVNGVKNAFQQKHKRDLYKDVKSETSGYFREGLLAIIRGPLEQDCVTLHDALAGAGTKESALNEVLLARSNADLNAIKAHYKHMYKRSLESDVKGDLSMKTERLFDMVMAARRNEESAPVWPQDTQRDVEQIYFATEGKTGTDQMTVCSTFATKSNGQLRAIAHAYEQKYHRKLATVIQKEFSGHMQDALLFMLSAAEDPAKHDAEMLEECMKGMGTKDNALVRRIITIHWDQSRLHQCKQAYRHFYKQDLAQRIRGETSGDYEKLMVACTG